MGTFIISSLVAWLALMLYVGWLGRRQLQLQRFLDETGRLSSQSNENGTPTSKAA